MNPFQSFFENPFQSFFDEAFGSLNPLANADNGNMLFHASSSFAEQGPDGMHYAQSQSSSFGPEGVSLSCHLHLSFLSHPKAINNKSIHLPQVAEHQRRVKDGRTGQEEMTISRHLRDKVWHLAFLPVLSVWNPYKLQRIKS